MHTKHKRKRNTTRGVRSSKIYSLFQYKISKGVVRYVNPAKPARSGRDLIQKQLPARFALPKKLRPSLEQ